MFNEVKASVVGVQGKRGGLIGTEMKEGGKGQACWSLWFIGHGKKFRFCSALEAIGSVDHALYFF